MTKWIGGVVATIIAGVVTIWVTEAISLKTEPPSGLPGVNNSSSSPEHSKCDLPWSWSASRSSCIQSVLIPETRYSVNLDRRIKSIAGRVDFYLNEKRLPGNDNQGKAMYKSAPGVVQVVIPIMRGKVMVGDTRQVIFSSNEGKICELQGLPQATGWMKMMHVSYLMLLEECGKSEGMCSASLELDGKRVQIKTNALKVIIAKKKC